MKKVLCLFFALLMLSISLFAWADENWTCPNCGATNGPSKAECWQCGVVKQGGSQSAPKAEPKEAPKSLPQSTAVDLRVGDYLTFGVYPQTKEGTDRTPIEWLVLDVQDTKAFLISRYALDTQPYNTVFTNVTWETCSLRSWLNNSFYNAAFSSAEKDAVLVTECNNSKSQGPERCADGGKNTKDKVFLLSNAEAMKYFLNESSRRCLPTAYARERGVWVGKGKLGKINGRSPVLGWWLRSPGWNQRGANIVYIDGETNLAHNDVSATRFGIRPALWVDTSLLP